MVYFINGRLQLLSVINAKHDFVFSLCSDPFFQTFGTDPIKIIQVPPASAVLCFSGCYPHVYLLLKLEYDITHFRVQGAVF